MPVTIPKLKKKAGWRKSLSGSGGRSSSGGSSTAIKEKPKKEKKESDYKKAKREYKEALNKYKAIDKEYKTAKREYNKNPNTENGKKYRSIRDKRLTAHSVVSTKSFVLSYNKMYRNAQIAAGLYLASKAIPIYASIGKSIFDTYKRRANVLSATDPEVLNAKWADAFSGGTTALAVVKRR